MAELIKPNNAQKLPPDGPAIFVNSAHIVNHGGAFRLVFLESEPSGERKFRTAVVMPLANVIDLKNMLIQLCSQVQVVQVPAQQGESLTS